MAMIFCVFSIFIYLSNELFIYNVVLLFLLLLKGSQEKDKLQILVRA